MLTLNTFSFSLYAPFMPVICSIFPVSSFAPAAAALLTNPHHPNPLPTTLHMPIPSVLPALFRLELHRDKTAGKRSALLHPPGNRPGVALPENVRRARRRAISGHGPFGATPSPSAARPAGRRRAGLVLVEILGFRVRG